MSNTNYEEIKGALRLRLYGANRTQEEGVVQRDGAMYGFEGLTVVPVLDIGDIGEGHAVGKLTEDAIKGYGVSEDTVFEDAIANMREDRKIMDLSEMMMHMMGITDELPESREIPETLGDTPIIVVTNGTGVFGAATIIALADKFIERFPMGYTVLPSSVHEVLVVPNGMMDEESLNGMVKDVNANVVAAEDYLSDDVYVFEA